MEFKKDVYAEGVKYIDKFYADCLETERLAREKTKEKSAEQEYEARAEAWGKENKETLHIRLREINVPFTRKSLFFNKTKNFKLFLVFSSPNYSDRMRRHPLGFKICAYITDEKERYHFDIFNSQVILGNKENIDKFSNSPPSPLKLKINRQIYEISQNDFCELLVEHFNFNCLIGDSILYIRSEKYNIDSEKTGVKFDTTFENPKSKALFDKCMDDERAIDKYLESFRHDIKENCEAYKIMLLDQGSNNYSATVFEAKDYFKEKGNELKNYMLKNYDIQFGLY